MVNMSLYSLAYVSNSATAVGEAPDLEDILRVSRAWNADHDITGILLYKDGLFLQILEGPKNEVKSIFRSISQDTRHSVVTVVLEGDTDSRDFDGWLMGFRDLTNPELDSILEHLKEAPVTLPTPESTSRARRLMRLFSKTTAFQVEC
jgi:hypothetical protein